MWLPMSFTYSRNYTVANITAGKYSNIRLMAGDSQHGRAYPWKTAKDATICHNGTKTPSGVPDGRVIPCDYNGPPLFRFSAACWYFAEARPAPFASRSVRRALLTPQANPGSLYRCGRST